MSPLEVLSKLLQSLSDFPLSFYTNFLKIFNRVPSFFKLHHLKDMGRQQDTDFFPFLSLILEQQNQWSQWVMVDQQRHQDLDLIITWYGCKLKNLSSNFVLIGVHHLPFHFCKSIIPVVHQVQQQIDLVWLLKLSYHTHLQPIRLVQQLLFFQTSSSKTDLKLLTQNVVIRQTLDTLSLVLQHLHLSRHSHRLLHLTSRRQGIQVYYFLLLAHVLELLLQFIILRLKRVLHLRNNGVIVIELEYLYPMLIQIRIQLLNLTTLLLNLLLQPIEFPLLIISQVTSQPINPLPLRLQLILQQFILLNHKLQLLLHPLIILLANLRSIRLVMQVLLLQIDIIFPQHLHLLPQRLDLPSQPLHHPFLLLRLRLQPPTLLLRLRQPETITLQLIPPLQPLPVPSHHHLQVSPYPFLSGQPLVSQLHSVLLPHILNVPLQQIHLLPQRCQLLLIGTRVGSHKHPRCRPQLGAVVVVTNLDALRFKDGLTGVVHMSHPLPLAEIRAEVELPAVQVEKLLVNHTAVLELIVV